MPHTAFISAPSALRALVLAACCVLGMAAQAQVALVQDPGTPQAQARALPAKGGYVLEERKPLPPEVQETLRQINAYRAAGAMCGGQRFEPAAALAWSELLHSAAVHHAQDMARRRTMSHTGGDGSDVGTRATREGYAWGGVGENVSAGYKTEREALAGWMSSPGHCSNMMSGGYTEVGVGAAFASGDSFGWYRAMVLAKGRGKP
jgi:uncharacterized protein YkwD